MSSVSIVIPARNAAATLNAAIASVVRQTHTGWEIIVIDDGSTDSTAANARAWCDRGLPIRLISGRKHGLTGASGARNEAARHAVKPWLLFLDADDLILPTHLATMLAAANAASRPVDIVCCGGVKMAFDGRLGATEMPPQENHFKLLASRNSYNIHACLVRRSTFEKFGGFDEGLKTCEEWDLWQRFARAGTVFAQVEEALTVYRLRPSSLSHKADVLFENARKVIMRGHSSDPRVPNPPPAFAKGQPAEEAPLALIAFAAWYAGVLIGSGNDAEAFLQRAELPRTTDIEIDAIVSMLEGGVPVGACTIYEDWPTLWPVHEISIKRVFQLLQEGCAIPNLAARCIAEFENRMRDEFERRQLTHPVATDIGFETILSVRPSTEKWASPILPANTTRPPKFAKSRSGIRQAPIADGAPIILMYHRIDTPTHDPWLVRVSKENLSEQLQLLSAQRDVVPMSWLIGKLKEGTVPRGTACLTFDDGYADVLYNGKPILEKLECPATVFLPTKYIGNDEGFWWDVLIRIMFETSDLPPQLTMVVRGVEHQWQLRSASGNGAANAVPVADLHLSIWKLLKPLQSEERSALLEKLALWAGTDARPRAIDRTLSLEELSRVIDPGFIDVGAHTLTHPSLPTLSDQEMEHEITASRKACEELSGAPVDAFAYPFGDLDERSASAVHAAGFEIAYTTIAGAVTLHQDRMQVPRVFVGNWGAEEFEREVLFSQEPPSAFHMPVRNFCRI